MAASGSYFGNTELEDSDEEFSSKFASPSTRVVENRPYDEVFDVLQGDQPIEDEEESEVDSDDEQRADTKANVLEDSVHSSDNDDAPTTLVGSGEARLRLDQGRDTGGDARLQRVPSLPKKRPSPPGSVKPERSLGESLKSPRATQIEKPSLTLYGHRDGGSKPGPRPTSSSSSSSSSSGSASSASGSSPDNGNREKPSGSHRLIRGNAAPPAARGYRAEDFANLDVSDEIKDLFGYIGRYNPHTVELETRLKPFIPDLVPAVGEVDAMIKISPPSTGLTDGSVSTGDGPPSQIGVSDVMKKLNGLGLVELDEPSLTQSDPAVVQLVQNWIEQIEQLHEERSSSSHVTYSHKMPSLDRLMQAWPPEMLDHFTSSTALPDPHPDLDVDLVTYIRMICAMLDIPIYDDSPRSIIEALHVLFSLYLEFATNPHFAASSGGAKKEDESTGPVYDGSDDNSTMLIS
ncbi:hypothetical protein FOL47_006100 [Perkinsus chesapeaki]|uniref:Intraflagellar transport protein 46 n=1 Tax=Perkinsus chesapeaki TaxID=330153 RepID=A0A7J6MXV3_PERCH|nr:hypothetical protein FOL47_006100 [Perkinsus chesapeaki]